jgi:hypothetical protein
MPQPQGTASWATNANYASPGDPWDGTPTKVNPPSGKTDEGWEPTEELAAQFQNDWQNRAGALLEHFRLIQPSNWTLERDISPTTPQQFRALGYDGSTGTLIVSGDTAATATFRSLNGGRTWIAPTTPPIAIANSLALYADGAGNWVVGGDSLSVSESGDDGDTWTTRTLGLASDQANRAYFDAFNSLWIVTGENVGGSPGRRLWTSPDRITWTARVSDAAGGGTFIADVWTNAAGFSVALADSNQFFTSANGTAWTQRALTGAVTVEGVVYSEAAGIWMITGTDSGGRTVFTSTDGITFTTPIGAVVPTGLFSNINCDQGELFLIGYGSASANAEIYASFDRGLTWTQITGFGANLPRGPAESGSTPTGASSIAQNIWFFAGKFMRADNAGNFWHSLAMG